MPFPARIPSLVVGALVLGCLASPAGAASKAPCGLISDISGDAQVLNQQSGMDVLSADIAGDGKQLTVAIRLRTAPQPTNPEAPGGTYYYFEFMAPGSDLVQFMVAEVSGVDETVYTTGSISDYGGQHLRTDASQGNVAGRIDGNVITMTVPARELRGVSIKKGAKISRLRVQTVAVMGAPARVAGVHGGHLLKVDDASVGASYVVGTRSCIRAGR